MGKSLATGYKATVILFFCACCAVVSVYQFHFYGQTDTINLYGLFAHGFLAATIGGLADWFAVVAIFRKPMGFISYRTEILKRNRQRIMQALVDFLSDDLLSTKNILSTIEKENFALLFVHYVNERGGKSKILSVVNIFLHRVKDVLTFDELPKLFLPVFQKFFASLSIEENFSKAVLSLNEKDFAEQRQNFLCQFYKMMRPVLRDDAVKEYCLAHIDQLKQNYIGDNSWREKLFVMTNLTSEAIFTLLRAKCENYLDAMQAGNGELNAKCNDLLKKFLKDFAQNENVKNWLTSQKNSWQKNFEQEKLNELFQNYLQDFIEKNFPKWLGYLEKMFDEKISALEKDSQMQKKFNDYLLNFFAEKLEEHHEFIPELIQARLNKMSDEELVDLAEKNVAEDLQMIRINGSLVGGLVGMGLYVLVGVVQMMVR